MLVNLVTQFLAASSRAVTRSEKGLGAATSRRWEDAGTGEPSESHNAATLSPMIGFLQLACRWQMLGSFSPLRRGMPEGDVGSPAAHFDGRSRQEVCKATVAHVQQLLYHASSQAPVSPFRWNLLTPRIPKPCLTRGTRQSYSDEDEHQAEWLGTDGPLGPPCAHH